MKILLAADGSTYTKRMLAYVAAHYDWLGPHHRYTVVYAMPKIPPRAAAYFDRDALTHKSVNMSTVWDLSGYCGGHSLHEDRWPTT